MQQKITYYPIGIMHSPHKKIEDMPIQPVGAKGINGEIEVLPEFTDGLKDLDGFSHIFVLFHFHKTKNYSLQVKPFLDNEIHGIFATRAPKRPNRIGISVLKLIKIETNKIFVENVDLLDKTPILDIKPYSSKFDMVENEKNGWLEKNISDPCKTFSDERFK